MNTTPRTTTTTHAVSGVPTTDEPCPRCGDVAGVRWRASNPGSDELHCAQCGHDWTIAIEEPIVADDALGTPRPDTLTARAALDAIAQLLRDPRWGLAMLEDIGELVTRTGRDLTGDGSTTWHRH
jgi:predicted RNA-binding Zn-ribbon protein involved in translation (DUF1610 family)